MPAHRSIRALRFAALPVAAVVATSLASPAIAQADSPSASQAMLPRELEGLAQWLAQKHPACTERCFVLESMKLTGALASGALSFEIHGSVIADGPVAVPLFGPVAHVRIESALEDGKAATIGFEGDRYFLNTSSKRFVLKGTLAFTASNPDRSVTIAGPLNALDAEIDGGRMLEGNKLSGLAATTLHFEATADDAKGTPRAEPPIFQIARAVRIGREVDFDYRVTARAGADVGELRLPLGNGEKVVEVSGAREWKVVDGATAGTKELLVSTTGHCAVLTITGTLPQELSGKTLVGDPRAAWEHWLVESDAEHQVKVDGEGKQIDVSQSPVGATQPSARLFLVKRGQKLALDVHALSTIEALAAVVPSAARTLVLTEKGDLVAEDFVSVQNNGVDYLSLTTGGRPIFVSTDDVGEKLLRRDASSTELLVPLKNGLHTVRVQSASDLHPRLFGGALTFPELDHALTTSRQTVTIGLPRSVHPIALLGGARTQWMVGEPDAIALAAAVAAALLLAKGRRDRVLAATALAGTWFVSPGLFVGGLAIGAFGATGAVLHRRLRNTAAAKVGVFVGVAIAGAALMSLVGLSKEERSAHYAAAPPASPVVTQTVASPSPTPAQDGLGKDKDKQKNVGDMTTTVTRSFDEDGKAREVDAPAYGERGFLANASITPVALPLPTADHYVSLSRELVTRERPLNPV
ncbi:MAG: hypothetical protein ACHREM_20980, partial [Polyangiales bacterium]